MLKEIFGGERMVENVKIVPDRNVSSIIDHGLTGG
jgi:hypothetical protein